MPLATLQTADVQCEPRLALRKLFCSLFSLAAGNWRLGGLGLAANGTGILQYRNVLLLYNYVHAATSSNGHMVRFHGWPLYTRLTMHRFHCIHYMPYTPLLTSENLTSEIFTPLMHSNVLAWLERATYERRAYGAAMLFPDFALLDHYHLCCLLPSKKLTYPTFWKLNLQIFVI